MQPSQQSPILAFMSVDADLAVANDVGPLTRFGTATLMDQQLAALMFAGISNVAIFANGAMHGLDEIITHWRAQGLNISVFPDRKSAEKCTAGYEMMLLMAHNLIATPTSFAHAAARVDPILFVRDAATSDERHERIDLNDRWTGIALLPVKYLDELPELAEDWSLQSALLRQAVQNGIPRETMAIGPSSPLQSEIIVDFDDVDRWQTRQMDQHFAIARATASPFRRWVSLPLAHVAVPLLWHTRADAVQIATWIRYALLALAVLLALLQWPIAALCCLILVLVLEEIDDQNTALSVRGIGDLLPFQVYSIIWFALPAAALMSAGTIGHLNAFLIGAVAATSVAVTSAVRPVAENWVVARQEAVVLALCCALAGLSLANTVLLTALAVMVSGFWRPIWSRLNAI
jgi:hypothetical protein